jgi:alpha-beta hydrolase superfamily lysophospholipase
MSDFNIRGVDDIKIQAHNYLVKDEKAIVLCVHGMAEHSKRYETLAYYLNDYGYSVYTYDHRGHGESLIENEQQGYLGRNGFNKIISELDMMVSFIQANHPNKKLYLLGHSMGSFIVQGYIQKYNKVSGVILSGSDYKTKGLQFGIFLSGLLCLLGKDKSEASLINKMSFGTYNKQFKPNRTEFDWVNSNTEEVDKYVNDTLCGFTCTNRFYYDFLKGLKNIQKERNIQKINKELPIFIIAGEEDPVGQMGKGIKLLHQTYKNYNHQIKYKLYPKMRHEILLETRKEAVFDDIKEWLETVNQ